MPLRSHEEAMALHLVAALTQKRRVRARYNLAHIFGTDFLRLQGKSSDLIIMPLLFSRDDTLLAMLGYFQYHSCVQTPGENEARSSFRLFMCEMALMLAAYGYWLPYVRDGETFSNLIFPNIVASRKTASYIGKTSSPVSFALAAE